MLNVSLIRVRSLQIRVNMVIRVSMTPVKVNPAPLTSEFQDSARKYENNGNQ